MLVLVRRAHEDGHDRGGDLDHVEDRRPRGAPLRLHDAGADRADHAGLVPRAQAAGARRSPTCSRGSCSAPTRSARENPLAAFHGRPEPLEAYFDATQNLPVATPLMRKDCSPICDGAAARDPDLAARRPCASRGSARRPRPSSILDRDALAALDATRRAAAHRLLARRHREPARARGPRASRRTTPSTACCRSTSPTSAWSTRTTAIEALVGALRGEPGDPLRQPGDGPARAHARPTSRAGSRRAATRSAARGCSRSPRATCSSPDRFPNPRGAGARTRASASRTRSAGPATTST